MMQDLSTTKTKVRIPSPDMARGFAILIMIEAHLMIIVSVPILTDISRALAAPLFTIVAGLSYELLLFSRRRAGKTKRSIFIETISRSIGLFGITILPSLIGSILLPSVFSQGVAFWSVFQIISVGYLIGFPLHNHPIWKLSAIICSFILYGLLNPFAQFAFLTGGLFPVLPFVGYFFVGQLIAAIYIDKRISTANPVHLIISSLVLITLSISASIIFEIPFERTSQMNPIFFLLTTGIQLMIFVLFILMVDKKRISEKFSNWLQAIGRIAFSAYYIHFAIIYLVHWSLISIGMTSISIIVNPISLFLIVGFIIVIENRWRKHGYIFGVEWILRRFSTLIATRLLKEPDTFGRP